MVHLTGSCFSSLPVWSCSCTGDEFSNTYSAFGGLLAALHPTLKHQQKKPKHWRYLEIPWGKNSIQNLLWLWELDLAIALETDQRPVRSPSESLTLRMLTNVSKMRSRLADRPHKFQALLQGSLVWVLIDPDVTTSPSCRFSEVGVSQLLYYWDGKWPYRSRGTVPTWK